MQCNGLPRRQYVVFALYKCTCIYMCSPKKENCQKLGEFSWVGVKIGKFSTCSLFKRRINPLLFHICACTQHKTKTQAKNSSILLKFLTFPTELSNAPPSFFPINVPLLDVSISKHCAFSVPSPVYIYVHVFPAGQILTILPKILTEFDKIFTQNAPVTFMEQCFEEICLHVSINLMWTSVARPNTIPDECFIQRDREV